MYKWNKDYADLLAPHYERLRVLMENGPNRAEGKEAEFYNAITSKNPSRPLQFAWLSLAQLPDETRERILKNFGSERRASLLAKSREALLRLEGREQNSTVEDYYEEMLSQGISAPKPVIDEPLGSREEHLRERAKGKYNGR